MRLSDKLRGCTRSFSLFSLALGVASLCSATAITYNVNQTIGAGGVTGFIETDGTIGVLGAGTADILDWNLLLNDGNTTVDMLGPLSGNNSGVLNEVFGGGSALSATATQLLFDFSGPPDFFLFTSNTVNALCFESLPGCITSRGATPVGVSLVLGLDANNVQFTSLSGTQVIGTTSTSSIPEPSTLALLGAGIALLGFRKLVTLLPTGT
jgi:hypothetical protein